MDLGGRVTNFRHALGHQDNFVGYDKHGLPLSCKCFKAKVKSMAVLLNVALQCISVVKLKNDNMYSSLKLKPTGLLLVSANDLGEGSQLDFVFCESLYQ